MQLAGKLQLGQQRQICTELDAALPAQYAEPAGIILKLRRDYGVMGLKVYRSDSVKSRRAGMGNPGLTMYLRYVIVTFEE